MNAIPRIRGRVGQFDEPLEYKGKWGFEISLWDFSGETMVGEPMEFGPFETEEMALKEMRKAVKIACEGIEKGEQGFTSGRYMDLKNGAIMRSWDEN